MASIKELRCGPEAVRLQTLREMVDHLSHMIENRLVDPHEARRRAGNLRFQVELLFPGKQGTFDLIYGARFERLIEQFLTKI